MTPSGYHIPELADVLTRPRLMGLLERHGRCRVVLVTGQAAQGKSTLVADFLRNHDAPSLWFHLNPSASDHGVLFETLVQGIRQWGDFPGDLSLPPQTTLGTREDLHRRIDALVLILAQAGQALNIVLDDMESLDEAGTAFEFISRLIHESPEHIRFFLLSRTLPRINLSRFRIKKQVLTLTNQDLAFTLEEAGSFFRPQDREDNRLHGLAPKDIEKILEITEGWAGGLVLVSEAIHQAHDLAQLPDRLTSEAFSYFSGEIYSSLTPDIRDFLMKTALFDELDTRILTAFFRDADPVGILGSLEKRNLFIRKISAGGQWPVFKYNNLFRDFLKADLTATLAAEEVAALNRKAGDIFWEHDRYETAVSYFMAGDAHREVARIVRIKGAEYVITGRADRLAAWINALPETMTREDPWLIFFSVMTRRIKGGKQNISDFRQALDLFVRRSDIRGQLLCIAYLIEASVFMRQPSQVILKWIGQGEQTLAGLKGQHKFTWARTLLWQQIGLGYIAGNGDIPKGISACRNAVLLARRIDNKDLVLNASVILTLGFVQSGDFSGARQMLEKISAMTHEGRHPEYRALKNITNTDLALKRGNLDLAGRLLEKSEADVEKFSLIFLYPGVVEARALYYAHTGQFDLAAQTADHLSDFSILEGNEFYLGIAHRIRAMCHLRRGKHELVCREAELAIQDLDRSGRGDIHLSLARQILGFALCRLGQTDRAMTEMEAVLAYFKGIGADLVFCETALALGVLLSQNNGTTANASGSNASGPDGLAREYLKAGFDKAVENQYRYFPLLDTPTLARAFVLAAHTPDMSPPDLAAYMNGFNDNTLLQAVADGICACLEKKKGKPLAAAVDHLRPLYKASRPRVMIRTLGVFSVHAGDRAVDPSAFGGAKPVLLLKAIVINGGRDVPKEVLVDALWPDAGAAAGEKNLKINLHRLRKALEPFPAKEFGYVYLNQKSGRISLDPDLVRIDTRMFTDLAGRGRDHEGRGSFDKALDCYGKALALYNGEYFAEDLYLEGAGHRRDLFRRKCMEILARTAAIHEELGQWQAAVDAWQAVLEMDACHEEAYRNLMILHADAGLKSEAFHLFDQCRAMLKKELDASPDPRTMDVYHRMTRT
ncbi:MAG: BTAD domain-containing putative transcriptional regulator [Desulfobacter sp.]